MPAERRPGMPVADLMREPLLVPESLTVDRLVDRLSGRRTMAVVIDEYGGTAGVATLEDIVEEVVGQVRDEHDPHETPDLDPAGTDEEGHALYWADGSARVDRLERLGLRVPEGPCKRSRGWSRPVSGTSPPSATASMSPAGGWTSWTPRGAGRPGCDARPLGRRHGRRGRFERRGRRGGRPVTAVQLLIGLATLVVNALFVAAEFALISVRRSQVETPRRATPGPGACCGDWSTCRR
ncbi:hypothetical protein STENM327S_03547 [Streptomyces tendae]